MIHPTDDDDNMDYDDDQITIWIGDLWPSRNENPLVIVAPSQGGDRALEMSTMIVVIMVMMIVMIMMMAPGQGGDPGKQIFS